MELFLQLIIVTFIASGLTQAYHVQTGFHSTMPFFGKDYLQFLEHKQRNHNEQGKQLDRFSNTEIHTYPPANERAIGHLWNQEPSFGQQFSPFAFNPIYNSPYASSLFQPTRPAVDSFLFSCDGLKTGFYADIYNSCKYFHLCHQPNLKFDLLNRLAITTYACPDETFFNQKRLTCTRLEDFEMSCVDQIKLFKAVNETSSNEQSDSKTKNENANKANSILTDAFEDKPISDSASDKMVINESVFNKLQANKLISENASLMNDIERLDEVNKQTENGQINATNSDEIRSTNKETYNERTDDRSSSEDAGKDDSTDIIETTFSCDGRTHGYYVDVALACRIFHVCQPVDEEVQINHQTSTHFMNSFRCPYNLVFNQVTLTCTNEKDLIVPCEGQEIFYTKPQAKPIEIVEPNKEADRSSNQETNRTNVGNDEIDTVSPLES